ESLSAPRFTLCSRGTPPTNTATLSLHDALPICAVGQPAGVDDGGVVVGIGDDEGVVVGQGGDGGEVGVESGRQDQCGLGADVRRSEEHTSELQSRFDLVCRLLLEKKKERSSKDE